MFAETATNAADYLGQIVLTVPKREQPHLIKAWNQVIAKHEILRTSFINTTQGAYQVIHEFQPLTVEYYPGNLQSGLPKDSKKPFESNDKNWIRLTVGEDYVLVTMHHLVYDGWSANLYLQDLNQAIKGKLEATIISFKPFVEAINSRDRQSLDGFWKRYLHDYSPNALFPSNGQTESTLLIKKPLSIGHEAIKRAADLARVTIATVLKLAWCKTLSAYYQSNDITFADVLSGRDIALKGIDVLSGPTISVLPCRYKNTTISLIQELQALEQDLLERKEYG